MFFRNTTQKHYLLLNIVSKIVLGICFVLFFFLLYDKTLLLENLILLVITNNSCTWRHQQAYLHVQLQLQVSEVSM